MNPVEVQFPRDLWNKYIVNDEGVLFGPFSPPAFKWSIACAFVAYKH